MVRRTWRKLNAETEIKLSVLAFKQHFILIVESLIKYKIMHNLNIYKIMHNLKI